MKRGVGRGVPDDGLPQDEAVVHLRAQRRHNRRDGVLTGPQLATVVEETDKYGRVKVAFHWGSAKGELTSYWSRVSQNWAGKQWGGVFLPHKGHEVIVEFVDGDPDQPLVTGRVYNKDAMPPLTLPADKESSIIRDHGANEYRMDGKDGAQRVRVYSPHKKSEIIIGKDEKSAGHIYLSEGDELIHFKGNSDETIDVNKTEEVGGDKKVTVKGKCDELTTKDHTLEVQANYKIDTAENWTVEIGGDTSHYVVGDMTDTIDGKTSEVVAKDKKVVVKGKCEEQTTEDHSLEVQANYTLDTTKTVTVKSKDHLTEVEDEMTQKADDFTTDVKKYTLEAEQAIMKLKSKLEQQANDMKLNAKKSFELKTKNGTVKCSGSLTLKGKTITCNGGSLVVK